MCLVDANQGPVRGLVCVVGAECAWWTRTKGLLGGWFLEYLKPCEGD
jgi:hypothetical protein